MSRCRQCAELSSRSGGRAAVTRRSQSRSAARQADSPSRADGSSVPPSTAKRQPPDVVCAARDARCREDGRTYAQMSAVADTDEVGSTEFFT